jgi:hypothetical protein
MWIKITGEYINLDSVRRLKPAGDAQRLRPTDHPRFPARSNQSGINSPNPGNTMPPPPIYDSFEIMAPRREPGTGCPRRRSYFDPG